MMDLSTKRVVVTGGAGFLGRHVCDELGAEGVKELAVPRRAQYDLIDESASRIRMEIDSKPREIDEMDRKLTQLEIERQALIKEKDDASKLRLGDLEKEVAELKERATGLQAHWLQEKEFTNSKRMGWK